MSYRPASGAIGLSSRWQVMCINIYIYSCRQQFVSETNAVASFTTINVCILPSYTDSYLPAKAISFRHKSSKVQSFLDARFDVSNIRVLQIRKRNVRHVFLFRGNPPIDLQT
jgi:hypothetical protein